MADPVHALILDLLEWIGPEARPYLEVMNAWRTSCPRLPVWEEAMDRQLVELRTPGDAGLVVCVSRDGQAFLRRHRGDLHPHV